MTEYWDAYDENRHLLPGTIINRDTFSTLDDYHLVVQVLLLHKKDHTVLFMRRSDNKATFPAYYEATAGGAALRGETSEEAARRELKEETHLEVEQLNLLYQVTDKENHMHFDKYLALTNADKEAVHYQEGETDGHVWVEPSHLSDFLTQARVVPSQVAELEILFHLKGDK